MVERDIGYHEAKTGDQRPATRRHGETGELKSSKV